MFLGSARSSDTAIIVHGGEVANESEAKDLDDEVIAVLGLGSIILKLVQDYGYPHQNEVQQRKRQAKRQRKSSDDRPELCVL